MFLQTPRATRYTNSVEKGLKKLTCIVTVTTTVKQLFTKWAPDNNFPITIEIENRIREQKYF